MSQRKNQHIVPSNTRYGRRWALKGEGNSRNTFITKSKREAVKIGKDIARNQKTELIIHNKNGRIAQRYSYGNDPFPPKG